MGPDQGVTKAVEALRIQHGKRGLVSIIKSGDASEKHGNSLLFQEILGDREGRLYHRDKRKSMEIS